MDWFNAFQFDCNKLEADRTSDHVVFNGCIPYGSASRILGSELSSVKNLTSALQGYLDNLLWKSTDAGQFISLQQEVKIPYPSGIELENGFVDPFWLRGTTDPIEYHRVPTHRHDRDIMSDLFTVFVFVLVKKEREAGAPLRGVRDRRNKSRSRTPQRRDTVGRRQDPNASASAMETEPIYSNQSTAKPAPTYAATPTYANMPTDAKMSTQRVSNTSANRSSTTTSTVRRQRVAKAASPRHRQRNTYSSYIEASDEAFINQDVRPANDDSFESARQDDSNEVSDDSYY